MFKKKNVIFVLLSVMILLLIGCTLLPLPTPQTYTITSSAGEGGSISPWGETTVTEGATQTYAISPDEGYAVSDLLIDDESVGALTTYTFTNIQANHTISALFTQEAQPPAPSAPTITRYTITASAGTGGSIDPAGSIKVNKGGSQAFTITPLPCYITASIFVDGLSIGVTDTYSFINIQENHTIQASFVSKGPGIYNINKDLHYPFIQDAIAEADSGDTIIVCPGFYFENLIFDGSNQITVRSTDPSDHHIVAATIIDGGSSSVVTFTGGDSSTLAGFTLRNGDALSGGGIKVIESSPYISNNTITGNIAEENGGGIYLYNSSPIISNNIITGNIAPFGGGGIIMIESSPTIMGNTITGNIVNSGGGGGIFVNESTPTISGNNITGNKALVGGGIVVHESNASITNNNIIGNTAVFTGGGLNMYKSTPTITGNNITGNSVILSGGGIFVNESTPTITGNNIAGNEARDFFGGGICVSLNSNLLPANDRPTGWGTDRESIPPYDNLPIAGNTFYGNSHVGAAADNGDHVYFE